MCFISVFNAFAAICYEVASGRSRRNDVGGARSIPLDNKLVFFADKIKPYGGDLYKSTPIYKLLY